MSISYADLDKAIELAEQGYIKEGRLELIKIVEAADEGDAKAQYEFGLMWAEDYWLWQSDDRAYKWWLKSAKQDYPLGQLTLGIAYMAGIGVGIDFDIAKEWLQKVIDNPNSSENLKEGAKGLYNYDFADEELESKMYKKKLEAKEAPEDLEFIRYEESLG